MIGSSRPVGSAIQPNIYFDSRELEFLIETKCTPMNGDALRSEWTCRRNRIAAICGEMLSVMDRRKANIKKKRAEDSLSKWNIPKTGFAAEYCCSGAKVIKPCG